jgi:hypothetical protein
LIICLFFNTFKWSGLLGQGTGIYKWETDCKNRKETPGQRIEYDDKGDILDQYTYNKSLWISITLEGIMDKLYNKICVTPKKPLKKK